MLAIAREISMSTIAWGMGQSGVNRVEGLDSFAPNGESRDTPTPDFLRVPDHQLACHPKPTAQGGGAGNLEEPAFGEPTVLASVQALKQLARCHLRKRG